MKILSFNKTLGKNFGKKYIPKIYIRLISDELRKKDYNSILNKVNEKYKIDKNTFKKALHPKNIIVSEFNGQYVVSFNQIALKEGVLLEQIINYINDGDLSFRGCNLFDNIISYISTNIRTIYMYYLMRGEQKWE